MLNWFALMIVTNNLAIAKKRKIKIRLKKLAAVKTLELLIFLKNIIAKEKIRAHGIISVCNCGIPIKGNADNKNNKLL